MKSVLERSFEKMAVEVETGSYGVLLETGGYVAGEWASKATVHRIQAARRVDMERPVALYLLNSTHSRSYEDAALDFTAKFGPLTIPFSRGEPFRFSVKEWRGARQKLHIAWMDASLRATKSKRGFYLPLDGDHFGFDMGRITFRTQRLLTYAAFEIASIPAQGLKMCANFGRAGYRCKAPFFFASDLRQKHCSDACAKEASKRSKLKWWNENRAGGAQIKRSGKLK